MTQYEVMCLADSQFGSEDRALHKKMVGVIEWAQPAKLVHVGDLLDCKAPSRWTRGTAEEFTSSLQQEIDRANDWLHAIRRVYDGPFDIKQGNHDERIQAYLERQAPALASLRFLRVTELLDLRELEIGWHELPFDVAPGWICAHGDEGKSAQYAGGTAMALARQMGKSVVCGHTHRAGLTAFTSGYAGKASTLYGMEVGHMMDMRKADYLKFGAGDWQAGYGVLHVNGRKVRPELVYL